jgi:hypothetical protein
MTPVHSPRAGCPVCGKDVALRRGGQLREHRMFGAASPLCPGSGNNIDEAMCRQCGCTSHDVGCWWVEADLCSECAP